MAESRAPRVLDLSRARCLSWCVRASGTPLPGAFIAFSHPNGGFSTLIWFQRADFILECDWFSFYNLFLFKKVKSSIKGSNSNQLFQILFSGTKLTSGVTQLFYVEDCRNYPPTTARLRTGCFLFSSIPMALIFFFLSPCPAELMASGPLRRCSQPKTVKMGDPLVPHPIPSPAAPCHPITCRGLEHPRRPIPCCVLERWTPTLPLTRPHHARHRPVLVMPQNSAVDPFHVPP
jgi:hypothetical protein